MADIDDDELVVVNDSADASHKKVNKNYNLTEVTPLKARKLMAVLQVVNDCKDELMEKPGTSKNGKKITEESQKHALSLVCAVTFAEGMSDKLIDGKDWKRLFWSRWRSKFMARRNARRSTGGTPIPVQAWETAMEDIMNLKDVTTFIGTPAKANIELEDSYEALDPNTSAEDDLEEIDSVRHVSPKRMRMESGSQPSRHGSPKRMRMEFGNQASSYEKREQLELKSLEESVLAQKLENKRKQLDVVEKFLELSDKLDEKGITYAEVVKSLQID